MDKLLVLEALTHIGANGPLIPTVGVCRNADAIIEEWGHESPTVGEFLIPYFKRWPECSPDVVYPVNGQHGYLRVDMWSMDSEVGRKRYRLLAYVIHELTKEVRREHTR